MEKIYLDEDGYQEYLNEIENIREKIRKNSSDITEFQSDDAYGDGWHDNFAYEQAMKKENSLFYELEKKLKGLNNIEIIKNNNKSNEVGIGSIVDIKFDKEEEIETYLIKASSSSKTTGEIPVVTINTPLGSAIYKKKVNDKFEYSVDNNTFSGVIINIRN